MPMTRMNALGIAGPRTIVPISSLDAGLEEGAVATPTAVVPTSIGISAGRPSLAQYEMTAQGSGSSHDIDLSLLLADRHDAPTLSAQFVETKVSAVASIDVLSVEPRHDTIATYGDTLTGHDAFEPQGSTVSISPVVDIAVAPAAGTLIADTAPATATVADFGTVHASAFRAMDGACGDQHEAFAMLYHDALPIDGTVPLLG